MCVKLDIKEVHSCHDCNYLVYCREDINQPKLVKYSCVAQDIDNTVVSTSELWVSCPLPSKK